MRTNTGCDQWFSLVEPALKAALAGRNRSLVARTGKCGWANRERGPVFLGSKIKLDLRVVL